MTIVCDDIKIWYNYKHQGMISTHLPPNIVLLDAHNDSGDYWSFVQIVIVSPHHIATSSVRDYR